MLTKASYITYLAFYPTEAVDSDYHLYCNSIQHEWLYQNLMLTKASYKSVLHYISSFLPNLY